MSVPAGWDRYRKVQVVKPPRPNDPVVLANRIPVIRVLRDLWSAQVPEGLGHRSWKTYCPLGWEHPDGGVDKGFRVYEQTNTSYCFVMHGSMGPVRLAQLRWGGRQQRAAQQLLEHYQLGKKRHWRERYEEVLLASESRQEISPAYVVEAFRMALSQIPGYSEHQYDEAVWSLVETELDALDEFVRQKPDEAQLRIWYAAAKDRLIRTITQEVCHGQV